MFTLWDIVIIGSRRYAVTELPDLSVVEISIASPYRAGSVRWGWRTYLGEWRTTDWYVGGERLQVYSQR